MGTPPVPLQVINHHRDDILDRDNILDLPPGFRFHPTDEEIITCYLREKVMDRRFTALAVAEVDLNKSEPWDLPAKATMGEKEWYFFCQRDRKYPTGMRTNRATESGYWKATGKDKEIYKGGKGKSCLIGMKKTLVFYKGRAPKGEKTNWVMHEYRLDGKLSFHRAAMEEWVICRVFHKNTGLLLRREPLLLDSFVDDLLENPNYTLPSLIEMPVSSSTPSTSTYPDDHHDVDFFNNNNNNYYYKQQDHDELLLMPKQEKEKSFDHQTLLSVPNSEFSEFRNYPNYITSTSHQHQHQQQQLSSNNSMISDNNTGLMSCSTTDVANEINSSIQGFDDSTKHFEDLDSLWNYY